MAGTISATSSSPLFSQILTGGFASRLLQSALTSFRTASNFIANPPQSSVLQRALRGLATQRSSLQGYAAAATPLQTRLGDAISGFSSVSTSLTSIKTLIEDTQSTPGNASSNQAAINALLSGVSTEFRQIRGAVTDATFKTAGVDANLNPFNLTRVTGSLLDGDGFTLDLNITTAAERGERTDYVTGLNTATDVATFTITGPSGTSSTIDVGATEAVIVDQITGLNELNETTVSFDLTGTLGMQTITIAAATKATIASAGGSFPGTDEIEFSVLGPTGVDSGTITIAASTSRDDAVTQINTALAGTGVVAYAEGNPAQFGLRTLTTGASSFTFTEITDVGGVGPNIVATQTATGTNAAVQAGVIAAINAVAGLTGVTAEAGSDNGSVTLRSTTGGTGAFITIANVTDTLPGSEAELGGAQTVTGSVTTQAQAISLINAQTSVTGVEAIAGTTGQDVTLRSVNYGTANSVSTTIVSDTSGVLAANATATGVDAVGTLSINGGTAGSLTAAGRVFTFTQDGVSGNFTVPGDTMFNPAAITVTGGNFLPIVTLTGTLVERININSLRDGFLGSSVSPGGINDIDVTSDADTALDIINQAIADLESDQTLLTNIKTNFVDDQISTANSRVASIDLQTNTIEDLQDTLNAFDLIRAQSTLNSTSLLLSQLASLFPISVFGLL